MSGLNLIVAMIFLVEPRSHREVAAALAHPLPEDGAVEGTTGAGVHENVNSAAGNVPQQTFKETQHTQRAIVISYTSIKYK